MQIKVLDKGFVRLDGAMADDWSVVNAARVSFNKQQVRFVPDDPSDPGPMRTGMLEGTPFGDAEKGLINFLMREKHGTPFEHNAIRFHVKAPIFIAREWFRHRIGSFNEWSGRYSKLEPEFYVPEYVRTQVGKPGAYKFEKVSSELATATRAVIERAGSSAYEDYDNLLSAGVAKEVARMVLPVNLYTQFFWTLNARSLMNFLSLRNADQAMFEIREYAKAVEQIWSQLMPVTAKAFQENDRRAP